MVYWPLPIALCSAATRSRVDLGSLLYRLRQREQRRAESVMLTLSTLGCGALVAVLTAMLARICSIGLPLPLGPEGTTIQSFDPVCH